MSEPLENNGGAIQAPGSGSAASPNAVERSEQFKTKPHLRPDDASDSSCDTMTQLIRPPDSVCMEAGVKKLLKISCHKCLQKLDVTFLESFSRFNCPSCEIELIVPRWFDNYLLEEPGGIGGMATVYRALDLALDREVAIKVLNPDVASQAERSELFLHEARTAATINHYAVIPIYTCGVFEGQPYIVMQYMGGGSLEAKLKLSMGSLPIPDVAKWMRDVAEGLDNARRHGITHHDIKPGNIMLDSDGNAKIGDFGLAQAVKDDRSVQVKELAKAWVSPHYVSPEKIRDGKEDFLGDVYSLGATFYHLVTGFTPFSSSSVDELLKMRLTLDPPPPHRQRPDLPLPLSHLILAMMDREPDKRPHYREIAKSLNEYLKSAESKKTVLKGPKLKMAATNLGISVEKPDEQPKPGAPDFSDEPVKAASPGRRPLAAVLNSAALLAIVGLAWYGWSSGRLQAALDYVKGAASTAVKKQDDVDKVPAATAAFASGDVAAAAEAAEREFSNVSAPADVRSQAAVQLALAKYLAKDQAAKDSCAFIAERLEAIRAASPDQGAELSLGEPPAKAIVGFLGNYDNKPSDLADRLSSSSPSLRLAGSLAIFLRSTRTKMPKEMVLTAFSDFKKASQAAPKGIWGNAWQERLDVWSGYLEGAYLGQGAEGAPQAEPAIATLPQQIGIKPGEKPKPKVVVFNDPKPVEQAQPDEPSVKPGLSPQELALMEKFSENALAGQLSKQAAQRPRPSGLNFDKPSLDRYLASVAEPSKSSESARASIVSELRASLERTLLRIPMELDSFDAASGELGKGVLFTNGSGLIYKTDSGRTERFGWDSLGAKQFALLADSYSRLLESVAAESEKGSPLRRDAAGELLKLAVLSGWCGDYKTASQSAQRALRADSGLGGEAERLLLK